MILRIALLLVSLVLLVLGVDGLSGAEGRNQSSLVPALEAVAGAATLCAVLVLSIRARRRAARLPLDRVDEGRSPTTESEVPFFMVRPTPEFRRLMLVNLPPYATLSALEQAPPLGAQPAVRSAIRQVLPGITFNDHGLGQFNAADHSILMDLGVAPEVWAATVDVTGEAAPAALRRLIIQTGWRAYAPKLGRFITAEDLRV